MFFVKIKCLYPGHKYLKLKVGVCLNMMVIFPTLFNDILNMFQKMPGINHKKNKKSHFNGEDWWT